MAGKYLDLTGLSYLWNKIKNLIPGLAKKTQSIPWGVIDSSSTSTNLISTVDGISELRDGVCIILYNDAVSSEEGCTLNVNNLGEKPIYVFYDDTSRAATFFNVGKTCMFVYDSSMISGGCWKLFYPFSASNTYWANQQLTSEAVYNTEPEFKTVTINGSTNSSIASTENVVLLYDTEEKCIKFTFN